METTTTETNNTPMDAAQLKKHLRLGANASGLMLIVFFALIYGSSYVLTMILKQYGDISDGFLGALFSFLAFTLQYPVIVPIVLLVFHLVCGRKTGQRLRDSFRKPAVPAKTMLRWILIGLGVTYTSTMLSRFLWLFIQSVTGLEMVAQSFAADPHWLSMVTNLVAMIIYAPIFEEFMFRGTLLRSMEKGGDLPAALMCGIAFGLWHTNYDQTIYTAVMGFMAALLYFRTRTLLVPMLMHASMNTIGAVQSLFIGNFDPYELMSLETEEEMIEYLTGNISNIAVLMVSGMLVWGLVGLGLVLLIMELVNHKQLFRFEKNECGMTAGQIMKIYLTSPVMLIACIAMLVMTVLRAMGIL